MKLEVIKLIISLTEAMSTVERTIIRGKLFDKVLDLKLKEGTAVEKYYEIMNINKIIKEFCNHPSYETRISLEELKAIIDHKFRD
jgi:hypothetical protein